MVVYMKIAVLDIGGTSIKAGLFKNGSLDNIREYDTNAANGGTYVMERVKAVLYEYGKVDAIGISTAGQVDSKQGVIRYANSNIPGYTGMKVKEILEAEFHVPVEVENDVNAATIGEAYYGAGIGFKNFICLTYGTGVGGAIVIDRNIYRGSTFSAGEMGAMVMHPEDRSVKQDMYSGCYEKYASTTALVHKVMAFDKSLTDGRKIFESLHRADVKQAVDEWIDEIVLGLTSLIHIFNPECVILGGGVMLQEYACESVKERVLDNIMESYRHVMIIPAALGNKAGMFGAAQMVLMKLDYI